MDGAGLRLTRFFDSVKGASETVEIPKNFSPSTSGNDSPSSSSGSGGGSGGSSVKRPDNQSASKNGPRISNTDGGQIDDLLRQVGTCTTLANVRELTPRLRDALQNVRGLNENDIDVFHRHLKSIDESRDILVVYREAKLMQDYWDDYRRATAA